ncbi:MAG: alpha/beta hydrolase [Spirochaetaceae bacterium]|nr:MAG: alpha/beta hydrolase [Spirochaetaceae bacterium]
MTGLIVRVGAGVILAAAVLGGSVVALERSVVYHPIAYPRGSWHPEEFGLSVTDHYFETDDGLTLHAWHAEADRLGADLRGESGPRRTLLWFHGNAGNITHRADNMRLLVAEGIDVFIFDYRGFGRSEGRPSEKGLYTDARAAYAYLTETLAVPRDEIVFFGRSLGAAVAVELALDQAPAGLILESPFTSAPAMARVMFGGLPLGFLISSRFDTLERIGRVNTPVLIAHGDRDEIVPYAMGRRIYDAANDPKSFYRITGAGHNDTYVIGGTPYFRELRAFWEGL